MRRIRVGVCLVVAAAMFAVLLPAADAIFKSFGDSSYSFGTPVDEVGNQTVCADGFELLAASTPNDSGGPPIGIGLPTGHTNGEILVSPVVGVYSASLVDDYENPFELTSISTPDGFDLLNSDGVLAAPRYGQTSVDIVLADTYFSLPESDPPSTKPAEGIGSTMFVPDTMLPIGEDLVLVTGDYTGFGSHRRVTVIDCAPLPVDPEILIKNNVVKPDRGFRKIRVHIINDGTFDIHDVDNLDVSGGAPFKNVLRMFDVDGDGDDDLTFKVRTRDTHVACGDTFMVVSGTIGDQSFAKKVPINSRCDTPA